MNLSQAEKSEAKILIVDDAIDSLRLLANMLTDQGYNVRKVLNGQMALTAAQSAPVDLILLDITMPQINGYEVCQRLKANEQTADIPVIFISALDEVLDKVKAFAVGGIDYITKPFQFEEVVARVETQLTIRFLKQQLTQQTNRAERVESQYYQLFNHAIAGIFQISPDGFYQKINPALAYLYGYPSPQEMMTDLINKEQPLYVDFKRWHELTDLLEKQDLVSNFKSQVRRADGEIIWICETIWKVNDADGNLLYYEGTAFSMNNEHE